MLIQYDSDTLAKMTAALDTVCRRFPPSFDTSENREKIAKGITRSVDAGDRDYDAFLDAGMSALNEMLNLHEKQEAAPRKKFAWFGLKNLTRR